MMPRPSQLDRLLHAATRLFATLGVEGTSLRAVTRAARMNPAAVHYHLGDHEALVRAVLDRILPPLVARQVAGLVRVEERMRTGPAPLEAGLEAVIAPEFALLHSRAERDRDAARARGRLRRSVGPGARHAEALEAPAFERLRHLLARAVQGVERDEWEHRLGWARGLLAAHLARGPAGPGRELQAVRQLVAFLAPALRARPAAALPDSAAPVVRLT